MLVILQRRHGPPSDYYAGWYRDDNGTAIPYVVYEDYQAARTLTMHLVRDFQPIPVKIVLR